MTIEKINWAALPDTLSKEQFYKICHISKATARYLLASGKVPCHTAEKYTHKYTIKKADVMDYLKKRELCPEYYSPAGNEHLPRDSDTGRSLSADVNMRPFYRKLLKNFPDVITGAQISELTGYSIYAVSSWYRKGKLKGFQKNRILHVPKKYLIEFLDSLYFRQITRKSSQHKMLIHQFLSGEKPI